MSQPTLKSKRLMLRPFCMADAPGVQRLAGDRAIADTTLNVPHPYEDGLAEKWIETHEPDYDGGTGATFAIVLRDSGELAGAIGLRITGQMNKGELGYWIGRQFWNRGYATEAVLATLEFGFRDVGLNRISARHFARNPASGRVMEKAGMLLEGTARQEVMKWDKYEDMVWYGVLRAEWPE